MSRLLFLLLALLISLTLSAQQCPVSTQIGARRQRADDGVVSATVYAGHFRKMLTLNVVWQHLPPNMTSTFILHPDHLSMSMDVPDDWYDGQSALTHETLLFYTRHTTRQWHVSASAVLLDTPAAGILYLGPDSSIWLGHDAVLFTGNQLHFVERQPGVVCSAMNALQANSMAGDDSKRHVTLWLDTPLTYNLAVLDGAGIRLGEWNVTLHWGMDYPQTIIPADAAAFLQRDPKNTLALAHRLRLVSGAQLSDELLVAAGTNEFATTVLGASVSAPTTPAAITFGRRLLQQIAVDWAVDSHGHVAARFIASSFVTAASAPPYSTTTGGGGTDAIPESVDWVVATLGVLLVGFSAYWLSYLGITLQVAYDPPDEDDEEGVSITRRDLLFGVIILALSVTAHALMGVYGGHDVLIDASLEAPLKSFVTSFWIGTIFIAALFFVLLVLESARQTRVLGLRPSSHFVPVQLYAVTLGMVASRGVLAALLVSAGTSSPQLAVTALMMLVFVYFPSVYATLVLAVHVLANVPLYLPHSKETRGYTRLLTAITLLVSTALSILVGITTAQWLIKPFLNAVNGFYSPIAVQATTLIALAIPLYLVSFSITEQGKRMLEVPSAVVKEA